MTKTDKELMWMTLLKEIEGNNVFEKDLLGEVAERGAEIIKKHLAGETIDDEGMKLRVARSVIRLHKKNQTMCAKREKLIRRIKKDIEKLKKEAD